MKRRPHRKTLTGFWTGWGSTGRVLVVLLLATGCQEQVSDVPSNRKIRLGYPALSATVFPLMYAQEKGIFEQEGVEVEMTRIRGVARIVATLISGDIDVGWIGCCQLNGFRPLILHFLNRANHTCDQTL